jgi:hypothetical protein
MPVNVLFAPISPERFRARGNVSEPWKEGWIGYAFTQVQQKATIRIQGGWEMSGILRHGSGDASLRFGQIRIIGLLDVANDPTEALDSSVAGEPDALTGGNAAQQAFALDVANQRRQKRELTVRPYTGREQSWTTDQRTIIALWFGPLPAMFEAFGNRRPQRERIITEMIVEFDQTRENCPAGLNNRHARETRRRGLRAILNRNNAAFLDI